MKTAPRATRHALWHGLSRPSACSFLRVLVHHAVHGYERGHRLMASSMPLEASSAQRLAEITDASDAGADPAFPTILAAYPLADSPFIAVSKTRPALKADRPGAVVTHTLFLNEQAF